MALPFFLRFFRGQKPRHKNQNDTPGRTRDLFETGAQLLEEIRDPSWDWAGGSDTVNEKVESGPP